MASDHYNLSRFVAAQNPVFSEVSGCARVPNW